VPADGLDDLLAEQLRYYRARAGEYDDWWLRRGRYDRGEAANARWFAEVGEVEAALERCAPTGDVLELACGTGLWTGRLARRARRVTAVDAAPEPLALARERLAAAPGAAPVELVQADVFVWRRGRRVDACCFAFWLSHVPDERFDAFWASVAAALRPGGRVLFLDSLPAPRSTAADHVVPGPGEQTQTRRLQDGREFRVVKRFHDPGDLERRLAGLGWRAVVRRTEEFFLFGGAVRA
jgi:demethylmenaquinone methyltransferase/2-methoxy-6-polyprenyl-1,4-benzoquinol methylase